MTGAVFVLAINMAITTTMAIAFLAVGYLDVRNKAANWFGVAFLLATLSFAGEYVLHAGLAETGARMVIALAMLGCFLVIGHALARRYDADISPAGLATIFAASGVLYFLILDLPRADLWRQVLYQTPYTLVTLMGVAVVWRSGRRAALDRTLLVVLVLVALSFAAKPAVAVLTGGVGDEARDYAVTLYALVSQSSGAIAALLLAMTCLALVVSDSVATLVKGAERDDATGLLNQTGFERHGSRLLAAVPCEDGHDFALLVFSIVPLSEPVAETRPDAALADGLAGIFGPDALIARMVGMNFAVLMPGANLFGARRQAEVLRARLAAGTLPVSGAAAASIGIAEREAADSMSDLFNRAQRAYEDAIHAGGNQVRLAARSALTPDRGEAG